jgi:hypothetical protein
LNRATGGEIYVVGGTIRRCLFGDKLPSDVDIMVPNGDFRATAALEGLQIPLMLKNPNLRRYRWNALQIDLFEPRELFGGFEDVESALRFFDLKINALALHLRSGRVLDPFHIVSQKLITDPGIIWDRWTEMSPSNEVILAIRLAKIMQEMAQLTISREDAHRLKTEVVPRIRECDWREMTQRFPPGKDVFLELFTTSVLDRVCPVAGDRGSSEPPAVQEAPHGR